MLGRTVFPNHVHVFRLWEESIWSKLMRTHREKKVLEEDQEIEPGTVLTTKVPCRPYSFNSLSKGTYNDLAQGPNM